MEKWTRTVEFREMPGKVVVDLTNMPSGENEETWVINQARSAVKDRATKAGLDAWTLTPKRPIPAKVKEPAPSPGLSATSEQKKKVPRKPPKTGLEKQGVPPVDQIKREGC